MKLLSRLLLCDVLARSSVYGITIEENEELHDDELLQYSDEQNISDRFIVYSDPDVFSNISAAKKLDYAARILKEDSHLKVVLILKENSSKCMYCLASELDEYLTERQVLKSQMYVVFDGPLFDEQSQSDYLKCALVMKVELK